MFKILNGREHFYQWDLNQKLLVEDTTVNEVHFCTRACSEALVVEVKEEAGARVAEVPNILLQKAFDLKAYAYTGEDYTKVCETFEVVGRTKPSEYIYTETDVKKYEDLMNYAKRRYYIPVNKNTAVIGLIYSSGSSKCTMAIMLFAKSSDGKYKINMPFEYDENPIGLDGSYITNLSDFKPMIINKLIGNGIYSFEHINLFIEGYYTSCKYAYGTMKNEDGIIALYVCDYVFGSSRTASEFVNEFQQALEQTETIIFEYTKPETVEVEAYNPEEAVSLEVM